MKKRILSLLLCFCIVVTMSTNAFAASDEQFSAAGALYALGLFNGTGTDNSGNPTYDLDLVPTRNQAVTMLVRLLGKAGEAEGKTWNTPFTDVAAWAAPYIGYAYANGLTAGTSATTYSGNDNTTVKQYLTFILRALGYTSGVDFQYETAWDFSDAIGLTDGRYNENTLVFTRGDVTYISHSALSCNLKNSNISLLQKLYNEGVVTYEGICEAGLTEVVNVETLAAPTSLYSSTGTDNDAVLRWTAPRDDVMGYNLYVSTAKDGKYSLYQTGFTTEASIIEHTLKSGVTYYAKVQAFQLNEVVDSFGNPNYQEVLSEFSNVATFVIPGSTPSVPSTGVAITTLYLSDSVMALTPGETVEIRATFDPKNATPDVTWSSSNRSVAAVQLTETVAGNGGYTLVKANITTYGAGTAVITATTPNGVKAQCTVTVHGDNTAKAQAAVDALRAILKFPASLSLNSVRIYQGSDTSIVEIDYSAMNGFGGYNRGYFRYSGTTSSTSDYSVIDRYGYPYVSVDISKLK